MPEFVCGQCGKAFEVSESVLERYPGWTPRVCLRCKRGRDSTSADRGATGGGGGAAPPRKSPVRRTRTVRAGAAEENLCVADVLARYTSGPLTGVFTDGAAHPNPGPGGWGAVYVIDNQVVAEKWGHEPETTNNRMELTAILSGIDLVPPGTPAVLFTDSELCVKTFTVWAKAWEKRGWKRKEGAIKNLELVKRVYSLLATRPEVELRWIAAHSGNRWNEYADSLATAYRRSVR